MHQALTGFSLLVLYCIYLPKLTDARVCAPPDPLVRPACPGSWRNMTESDCDGLSHGCCWNNTVDSNYPSCYYVPKDVDYVYNMALHKPTFQKHTAHGGLSSKAVDGCGNTEWVHGCCSHTNEDKDLWWSVDLTRIYKVVSVTITTRNAHSYVEKFKILGSNTSYDPDVSTDKVECVDYPGRLERGTVNRIPCTTPITVRYLIIQKIVSITSNLVLCEVQVEVAGRFNAALGKLARQIGDYNNYQHEGKTYDTRALKALDGCALSNWHDKCTTHTGSTGPDPWWSVDLGREYMVHSVTIKNRDNYDKLQDLTIYTSNNTYNISHGDRTVCGTHIPSIPYNTYQNITCTGPIMARYVIITQPSIPLVITEVLVEAGCAARKYGISCQSDCHSCRDGSICDKVSGHCPGRLCASGYKGPKCDQCNGTFGQNCLQKCSSHCSVNVANICDTVSGECPQGLCHDGYLGPQCIQACSDGKYGPKCVNNCQHCRNNQVCDKVAGWCPGGLCDRGYQGQKCDKSCNGTFGENCLHSCSSHCSVSEPNICDPVSGECPQGLCHDGYLGPQCTQPCLDSTYGSDCTKQCSGNCLDDAVCDKVTGVCPDDACKPGYTGFGCFQKCPVGTYGASCLYLCSRTCKQNLICDFIDGSCPSGCIAGYQGDICDQQKQAECQNVVAIVVPISICFVVLVIAILIYLILKLRHKTPNNNNTGNEQSLDRQTVDGKIAGRNDQQNEGYYNIGQQTRETDIDKTSYEVPDEYKEQSTTYEHLNI